MILGRRDDGIAPSKVDSFELGLLGNGTDPAATAGLSQNSNGPKLLIISSLLTTLMVMVMMARLYTRKFILEFLGWDDWCMIIAVMNAIAMHGVTTRGVLVGQGKHIWNIDTSKMEELLKLAWIGSCFYVIALAFMKISLMLQLLRFCLPGSKTKKFIIAVFTIALAFSITNIGIVVFQCRPMSYMWTRINPGKTGTCLDFTIVGYFVTATNMGIDLMIWVAPMKLVWKLDLPRTQKFGLVAVFSLGGVALFAAIARMVSIVHTLTDPKVLNDGPFYTADTIMWSLLEADVAVIAASLLPLRPLFRRLFPTLFKRKHRPPPSIQLGNRRTKVPTDPQQRDFAGYSSSTEEFANDDNGLSTVEKNTLQSTAETEIGTFSVGRSTRTLVGGNPVQPASPGE